MKTDRGVDADCRRQHAADWFQAIVETAGVGLGLVDVHGVICYVNPWLAERIGRPADQLVGRSVLELLDPAGQAAGRAGLARCRAGRTDRYLLEYRCPDGDLRQLQVIGAPLCGDATVTGSVIVVADETARCRAEAELTRLAVTDALTGLPNRAALHDRLGQALARRRRQQSVLAVLFLDLDGFKSVNDRFGHAAGDQVLREVAARLAATLRPGDTVGRLGGDEFVVVCEELPDPSEADEIANRLQAALAPAFTVHGEQVRLRASVGVAVAATDQPVDPRELLHAADQAMYRAKLPGRADRA